MDALWLGCLSTRCFQQLGWRGVCRYELWFSSEEIGLKHDKVYLGYSSAANIVLGKGALVGPLQT